ncbi:hypothetical protein L3X38_000103 [Prunus dulcis]|uniref:Uncharacterized protein n=1 Tax=Prunus dulcis TaxID=3755 RepID=A0AAD4USD0_PRUDU|nr:hypothetical protein L3X38_000103 [Prunus dulcis]
MNRADPASKRLAPRQPRLLPCRRKTHFRAQLAPSPIRPRRLSFTPHFAMPTEDSRDTQHYTPRDGTSRRKFSGDATLQAEVERLRDSITKISEKYEHLRCRNAELEHDYRALKRNQERTRA